MPGFSTEVPHPLDRDAAVERLKSFLDKVHERYKDQVSSLTGEWHENVLDFELTAYTFKISGKLTVEDKIARLEGQLPFAALAFKGKIQEAFSSALRKELGSAGTA